MRDRKETTRHVGRPREFDEDEALAKIMSLFWKQGYERTGLSDIVKHTGLQKGSLYKAFGSKHEMYVRSLAHYESLVVDGAVKALTSDGDPTDRIHAFLSAPIDAAWNKNDRRGCFLCNASADHAALDADTQKLVERGYDKLTRALKVPVAQARPDWPSSKVSQVAHMAVSIYSGLRIMSRSGISRGILEDARDMGLSLLTH